MGAEEREVRAGAVRTTRSAFTASHGLAFMAVGAIFRRYGYTRTPMTITIEVPPEVEASLVALAAEEGLSLSDYLRRLLREQALPRPAASLSPGERAGLWRESAKGLPHTPPLSDDAISRDSLYDTRG